MEELTTENNPVSLGSKKYIKMASVITFIIKQLSYKKDAVNGFVVNYNELFDKIIKHGNMIGNSLNALDCAITFFTH